MEQIFADNYPAIKSKGDFLTQLGARPFYGTGRNVFYSFSHEERQCLIFSVSRTLSKGESLIITIDGNFFLHLQDLKYTNILPNIEQLQTKLEDLV